MRVLLINPYYPISETPCPPLGLAFLAAALEKAGAEVKILDFVVYPYSREKLKRVLDRFSPDMAGITSVTMSFDRAAGIASDLKKINPDILTILGGPHVSFCAIKTMKSFPEIDFVVIGEGEKTLVELAKEADDARKWNRVKGMVYRNKTELVPTAKRAPIADMDSLPMPSRHLFPLGRYRALGMPLSMTTSRGCPFKCIFCVGRKMVGSRVRYRSPEKVVDELEYLGHLDFHQINIADDLFTADRQHCINICNEIIHRGLNIEWTSFARVDTVSADVLNKMKTAGCTSISFGVESANPGILKTIKKGITTGQVISAVNMCNDAGILPQASFIIGLPGETPETLQETMDFGRRLKEKGAAYGFHILAPFPGTAVRENIQKFDLEILTDDWQQYHANRAIVETASVDRSMLDGIVMEWENKFDQWLGHVEKLRKTGEASKEDAWILTKLEHTVLLYDLMMERIIETKGSWKNNGRQTSDALKTLVNRISGSTKYTRQQLYNTLTFALDRKYLKHRQEGGKTRWAWIDFL